MKCQKIGEVGKEMRERKEKEERHNEGERRGMFAYLELR